MPTSSPESRSRSSEWLARGIVLLPYLLLAAIVPPVGDFPYTDDFDYAASTWHLTKTGRLVLSDWPAMTLVGHLLYGALFSLVLGPHWWVLRASMMLLSALTAQGLYSWSREQGQGKSFSALLGVLFAVNPINVCQEYSFMTDVTGAACLTFLVLFQRRLTTAGVGGWLAYSCLGGFSYLVRETSVIPFLLVAGQTFVRSIREKDQRWKLAALLVPAGVMFLTYQYWLNVIHGVPYGRLEARLFVREWWWRVIWAFWLTFQIAFQLFPLAAFGMVVAWRRRDWLRPVLIGGGLALACRLSVGLVLPPISDEVYDLGLRFPDWGYEPSPEIMIGGHRYYFVTVLSTVLALVSSSFLAVLGMELLRDRSFLRDATNRIAPVSLLVILFILFANRDYYERYTLTLLPLLLMTLASAMSPSLSGVRWALGPAWLGTALIGLACLFGIQDSLERSRVFWRTLQELEAAGMVHDELQAGLAHRGWYCCNPAYRGQTHQGPFFARLSGAEQKAAMDRFSPWRWEEVRTFRLGYGHDEQRYLTIASVPYRTWMRTGSINLGMLRERNVSPSSVPVPLQEWIGRHPPTGAAEEFGR